MAGLGSRLRNVFGGGEGDRAASPRASVSPAASEPFADGNDDFAVAMLGSLRQRAGNLFFSPFSVRAALGMAYAGAKGETAKEMREALRLRLPDEEMHAAFSQALQGLIASGGGEVEISIANSLWSQAGAPLEPAFRDLVSRHYCAEANLVDFRRATEAARTEINRWVEEATGQCIRELVPSGGVDAETRVALANAVYFKGAWERRFRKSATHEEPFWLDGERTVRAPLMYRKGEVPYLEGDGYQAVDLAYRGRGLSMLVLLPDRTDGLPKLEGRISERLLRQCAAKMREREVEVFLPRFKVTWGTVDVRQALASLGMRLAFDGSRADLSGINGRKPPHGDALFLGPVFHKAFVDVNEEGTEAAAATAAVVTRGLSSSTRPPEVPVFRADHPFLFAIRDRKRGTILFLGRLADPSRKD